MSTKIKMKAPRGCSCATIEGHEYSLGKDGIITVVSEDHIPTLLRHNFTPYEEPVSADDPLSQIDDMDKDDLVTFIEERGGEADVQMTLKKLRKIAKDLIADDDD